jgi:hypothetical protein
MLHAILGSLALISQPLILQNPDTLVTPSTGLPAGVAGAVSRAAALEGGVWGIGVVDLRSGETSTRNASRSFRVDVPSLPLAACGIELSNTGELPLDSMIARNERFWEKLHWAQQGGRGVCAAVIWSIRETRIARWLSERGFSGTAVHGVDLDLPTPILLEPNTITVENAISFLGIFYGSIDQRSVRRIGDNPPLSQANRETLGVANTLYGWFDETGSWRHIFIIVRKPSGEDYGIVILTENLCCPGKADQALSIIWDALKN